MICQRSEASEAAECFIGVANSGIAVSDYVITLFVIMTIWVLMIVVLTEFAFK